MKTVYNHKKQVILLMTDFVVGTALQNILPYASKCVSTPVGIAWADLVADCV